MGEIGKLKILLDNELKRLKDTCTVWENELNDGVSLPENATELIRCAIGKATLLVNGKLKQFSGLIASSETNNEENITSSDLQGFWDLICIEISGIDNSFCDLNQLKKNGWTENGENSWESKESANTHDGKVKNTKKTMKKALTTVNSYQNIPPRKRLADIKKEIKASRQMKTDEKDTVVFEVPGFFSVRSPAKVKRGPSSIRRADKE